MTTFLTPGAPFYRQVNPDTPAVCDSPAAVGGVVYISGVGHVDLALAAQDDDSDQRPNAVGIITAVNGTAVTYRTQGPVDNPAWSLTPGKMYYLSPTVPGGVTDVYPETAGQFVVILGFAATATQLVLSIHYMLEQS